MRRIIVSLVALIAVAGVLILAFLASLSPRDLLARATIPSKFDFPQSVFASYARHVARLSEPDAGAYPVTLLQFTLNGYTQQMTPEGQHRVREVSEAILRKGHDVNALDAAGLTSVHYAIVNRSPEVLQFLIDHGADVNRKSSKGLTPLRFAREHTNKLLNPNEKPSFEPVISLLRLSGAHE